MRVYNWKIFEFIKESNGQLSSTRLFSLLIIISALIEWQYAIWSNGVHVWSPSVNTVGLIAGILGFKVLQKFAEEKVVEQPVINNVSGILNENVPING